MDVKGKSSYQEQTSVHDQKYNMNAIVLQYYLSYLQQSFT